jgi:hypothetical protein
MKFIHAIDLDNFYPCWNLRISGRLQTPNYMALIDPGLAENHKPVDYVSIDELRAWGIQNSSLTPRSGELVQKAAILRTYQRMMNGYGEEILISDEERKLLFRKSDAELEFERERRAMPSAKVSRLSCLWLAERTLEGAQHLRNMLGDKIYILNVQITGQLNLSRVDTSWYDAYGEEADAKYIERYWSGEPHSATAKWEYLLDGEIQVEGQEQLDYVKQHGNIVL